MDFETLTNILKLCGAPPRGSGGNYCKENTPKIIEHTEVMNTSVRNPSKHCHNLLLTVHQLDNQNYLTQDNVA